MKLKGMGVFELLALRNWLEIVYTSGRGYISVSKDQLEHIKNKLIEVDREMLERVLNDDYVGAFFNENFEDTLRKLQSGEFDETEEESS